MRPDKGGCGTTLGVNFRGLASVENFSSSDYRRFWDDRPIIGDFATKQIDLDTSSLLHPGGSNAAEELAPTPLLSRSTKVTLGLLR